MARKSHIAYILKHIESKASRTMFYFSEWTLEMRNSKKCNLLMLFLPFFNLYCKISESGLSYPSMAVQDLGFWYSGVLNMYQLLISNNAHVQ